MSATIILYHVFRPFAGDRETVEVNGGTIRECLDSLVDKFPVFRKILYNAGDMLAVIVLYENETIVPRDLDRPVGERSEIAIVPMIQGG